MECVFYPAPAKNLHGGSRRLWAWGGRRSVSDGIPQSAGGAGCSWRLIGCKRRRCGGYPVLSAAPGMVAAGAFVGGLLAVLLALGLSALASGRGHASIALAGVAVHALAQTVLMVLKLTADPEKELASIEYWIMGSLNAVTLSKILIPLLFCGVGLAVLFLLYRQILLLSVEEEEARLLGVSVGRMRLLILFCATLAVTAVVSVTGLISFIGLLAPHTAQLLCRERGLPALWLSGLLGGVLLCGADMLARSIASAELPVSIFTSLLGAPFLIYLMMRKEG